MNPKMNVYECNDRMNIAVIFDGWDIDLNIQVAQSRDKVIKSIADGLESEEVHGYELDNGLVFRRVSKVRCNYMYRMRWRRILFG